MRALKTTWKHMRRSPYQAFAAILTMFLTLLLSGIFFLTTAASVFVLQYFESKPQISVFFSEAATSKDIEDLKKTLMDSGKIAGIKFVSKDEALGLYKEQNKNDPLLLEMVTADILPASLEVSAKDPKFLSELEPVIQKAAGIEEVVYQKDVVNTLISWTNAIRLIVGVLSGLLIADAILIIMTVTSMKIAIRREEVEILRLVGGSQWYIRWPFIWEAGLYGITGAVFAWGIILSLVLWQRTALLEFMGIIPEIHLLLIQPNGVMFISAAGGFFAVLCLVGFLLGSIGSFVAVNRYLKI